MLHDDIACHAHVVRFLGGPTLNESLSAGLAEITRAIDTVNGRRTMRMDLAGHVIDAVLVEGRSVTEVCGAHDLSGSRRYELMAQSRELAMRGRPQSKRPRSSPTRTAASVEDEIVALRCGYSGGHNEMEVGMRAVGVREFRDQATSMMGAGETLVIERHGEPIGFYVPIAAKDRKAGRKALGRLGAVVEDLLSKAGLGEDELADEMGRGRRRR